MGTQSLSTIADGILSSDYCSDILSSVGTVQDYAEHGCSTDLSNDEAGRVMEACKVYMAHEDKTSNVLHQLVIAPLAD